MLSALGDLNCGAMVAADRCASDCRVKEQPPRPGSRLVGQRWNSGSEYNSGHVGETLQGAQVIARILKIEGVEQVFCFPLTPILDAIAEVGIRPIVSRQERVAGNMADGFSRTTLDHRVGVTSVQDSAGAENAFAGLAQACTDSSRILFLPGHPGRDRAGVRPTFDTVENYFRATKYATRITTPESIADRFRRAFAALRSGRPLPALVEIPKDIALGEAPEFHYVPPRPMRSAGDPDAIREGVKLLLRAERPMIRCGQGILYARASAELTEVAELLAAPVMTTLLGKSAFNERHPLALGAGAMSQTAMVTDALERCDSIFAVGTSMTRTIFGPPISDSKPIVHATNDPGDIHKDCRAAVGIVGDAKLVLRQMAEEIRSQTDGKGQPGRNGVEDHLRSVATQWKAYWAPKLASNEIPINPYRVIGEFMKLVDPADAIVTHDSGCPRDMLVPIYESTLPRSYLGWGHSTQLGFSLGAAMGAKLAAPDKLVVNFIGDTGFGMVGMDVETAVRENIPILTIMLNNSVMGNYDTYIPIATEKYDIRSTSGNYRAVASGLGAYSERIEDPGEVRAALERGIRWTREGRPALLEFITKEERDIPYRAK